MITIGIQGLQGSFCEMAALHYLNTENISDYQLCYLINSHSVLKHLSEDQSDIGIFAIENSTGGVVYETIHALAHYNCHIECFFSIPITQNLLVKTGTTKDKITAIHSHQQALAQCQGYLSRHFKHAKQIEEEDTAYAAKQLAHNQLSANAAVIGNKACAELYNLTILEKTINDLNDNQTLFIAATALKGDK